MFNKIFLSYERIQHQDDRPFAERFKQVNNGEEFEPDFGPLDLLYVEFVKSARHFAFAVYGYGYCFAQQQSHGSQPVF